MALCAAEQVMAGESSRSSAHLLAHLPISLVDHQAIGYDLQAELLLWASAPTQGRFGEAD